MSTERSNRRPGDGYRFGKTTTKTAKSVDAALITTSTAPVNGYIDRYGNRHTDAIFQHWSRRVIRAMGIHRLDGGDDAAR
jgi:hypothetical protein